MNVIFGKKDDIDMWMALVRRISPVFPGLETEEAVEEHRRTVLRFMDEDRALCVKHEGSIAGVLLLSKKRNMICFLGVSPDHRRQGIASALLARALELLDRERDITVSTFRENDLKGAAPRPLYQKFGFVPDAPGVEFGYPQQTFVLRRRGAEDQLSGGF